jgi:hypothetical protein
MIDSGALQIRLDIIVNRPLKAGGRARRAPRRLLLRLVLAVGELLVRMHQLLEPLKLGGELVHIDSISYVTRI